MTILSCGYHPSSDHGTYLLRPTTRPGVLGGRLSVQGGDSICTMIGRINNKISPPAQYKRSYNSKKAWVRIVQQHYQHTCVEHLHKNVEGNTGTRNSNTPGVWLYLQ